MNGQEKVDRDCEDRLCFRILVMFWLSSAMENEKGDGLRCSGAWYGRLSLAESTILETLPLG